MCFVLFLAFTGHSSALYCVCKDGVGDQALQKAIDYACGAGADCTPILQNGACFQPNTVKDHCNYAVNSYFQRKGQGQGSCDFAGAATPSQNPPTSTSSCVYPSSPGYVLDMDLADLFKLFHNHSFISRKFQFQFQFNFLLMPSCWLLPCCIKPFFSHLQNMKVTLTLLAIFFFSNWLFINQLPTLVGIG